mgnify:FL=1
MKYNVNDLIYLCNHIDRYPNFRIDIELLLRGKSLKKVLADDKVLQNRPFDYKDKRVQVLCQKYGDIAEMVLCSATNNDVRTKLRKFDYVYEYILNNISKLNNIKELLGKLKQLGFEDIIFNTCMKLTTETFNVFVDPNKNRCITYLDNMEALSCADIDKITYMSDNSDYRIDLMTSSRYDNTLVLRGSVIYLTSLTFDKDRLPDSLEAKVIYDKVVSLTCNDKKLAKRKQFSSFY